MKLMPQTKPVQMKPEANLEVGWTDIAGVDEAKAELQEVVEFMRDPRPFTRLGAKVPKGVLLHGPPGTGKTLLAKAVAHESGAQFFAQSASSFVEMFAGLGAARIRRLFREALKNAPAIVFIDELDAVGARRGSDNNSEREQTLNQLLVEMDGFSSGAENRLVVMAASNLLDKLDPALLRPGRFDRQVFVSPPDVGGREQILRVHTANKPLREDVDLHLVAQQTSGLTGADLANICNEAAIFCARREGHAIGRQDFNDALERVIAGVQSSTTLNERERRVVAYHEAGHALCRELLDSVDRVHKISIVPRGSALGYVVNLPDEDSYLKTREELIDQMAVLLGGRVAEQIVFGEVTTGAASDLQRVEEITHAMIHQYAMGSAESPQSSLIEQASPTTRAASATRSSRSWPSRAGGPPGPSSTATASCSTSSPPSCWSARCSSATSSTGSWTASRACSAAARSATCAWRPRRRSRRPLHPTPTNLRRACSPGSTTSGWPSRTSTRPSPCTSAPTRWRSSTARSSRSRASRLCCSTSARITSSCCARCRATRRWGGSSPGAARACTTSPTRSQTSRRPSPRCASRACVSSTRRPARASAPRAWPSCTRPPQAAC